MNNQTYKKYYEKYSKENPRYYSDKNKKIYHENHLIFLMYGQFRRLAGTEKLNHNLSNIKYYHKLKNENQKAFKKMKHRIMERYWIKSYGEFKDAAKTLHMLQKIIQKQREAL